MADAQANPSTLSMEQPDNSSQSRSDEKLPARTSDHGLAKDYSHQEMVPRNGGDEEDDEGLGPVREPAGMG